jgi:hypothetical protein
VEFWRESVLPLVSRVLVLGLDPPPLALFDGFSPSTLPIQKLDFGDHLQIEVAVEKVVSGHRGRLSFRAPTHQVTYP